MQLTKAQAKHSLFQDEVGHFWLLLNSFQRKEMCRTLLKPGILYAKANWRQAKPHISMWTNTESCNPQWIISVLCMMICLAASSSPPKWCFIVLAFCVCIPLLLGEYKYPPLCTKTSAGPSTTVPCVQPSSIHQHCPCSAQGPPSSCSPPPASSLT